MFSNDLRNIGLRSANRVCCYKYTLISHILSIFFGRFFPIKREGTFRPSSVTEAYASGSICFDSLQTGRHIQTYTDAQIARREQIAFRFPSNGKAHSDAIGVYGGRSIDRFRFPSNGKAHSDLYEPLLLPLSFYVSIPFKREGTFRPEGKRKRKRKRKRVSIPFKREGSFRR